ncbi:hypothetical protein GLX30_05645 [Streptomyces sp. Tu 2975]|uniref:hypothetical protein n=1 Tax=Streptomyces sp. Tu 2975 TaxID=2676871 RepID=UPI00135BA401|nr:hypothetical protein [Streptomyces sp. Tu 2975]QIP83633.1 hypothetical protein GLX30_05645 [Streptomyces sp. Tu 2975]
MGGTWAGVRERVLGLRRAPQWRAVFGAESHGHGHTFELTAEFDEHRCAEPRRDDHPDDDAFAAAYTAWQAREDTSSTTP